MRSYGRGRINHRQTQVNTGWESDNSEVRNLNAEVERRGIEGLRDRGIEYW